MKRQSICLITIIGSCTSVFGQSLFTDVTQAVDLPNGTNFNSTGSPLQYDPADGWIGGLAVADYNDDGYLDIYVPNDRGVNDKLYRYNPVTSKYDEVSLSVGLTGRTSLPALSIPDGKPRSRFALWIDYNGDSLLDLFVIGDNYYEPHGEIIDILDDPSVDYSIGENGLHRLSMHPRLYKQKCDGTFTDVTIKVGFDGLRVDDVGVPGSRPSTHRTDKWGTQVSPPSAGDLDGDGYPEIVFGVLVSGGFPFGAARGPEFHLLANTPNVTGGAFRVYDVNRGTSDFTTGTGFPWSQPLSGHHQTVMVDLTRDGLLDIFNARDVSAATGANHLWSRISPSQNFADISIIPNGTVDCGNPPSPTTSYTVMPPFGGSTDMGIALGDYDNDGDIDMYVANIQGSPLRGDAGLDFCPSGLSLTAGIGRSVLYRNESTVSMGQWQFSMFERGLSAGIIMPDTMPNDFEWGCTFSDFDLDGFVDLGVTNGFGAIEDSTKFYKNFGPDPLNPNDAGVDFGYMPGWDLDALGQKEEDMGSTLLGFDFDRDGDVDVLQSTREEGQLHSWSLGSGPENPKVRLRNNNTNPIAGNEWITIRPRENSANTHSIGALVTLYLDDGINQPDSTPSRVITAGISMGGQEPYEAHFGLGQLQNEALANGTSLASSLMVRIDWLGDRPDTLIPGNSLGVDEVNTINPCSNADVAAPFGVVNSSDVTWFMSLHSAQDPAADFDSDGIFDFFDITIFLDEYNQGCTFVTGCSGK